MKISTASKSSATKIWIVGYYGAILHSPDRGANWQIQSSPARNALFTVRFVSVD